MPPKFRLTREQELEVIALYCEDMSIRNIAKWYTVGRTSIGYILKRYGVKTKSTGNSYNISKYTLDKRYFKKIDSQEKAYWLGFISADGHVSDDGIVIGLHKKDYEHLENFLISIKSNSKVKYIKNAAVISIYSKELVSDLRDLGFFHNKSQTQTFPPIGEIYYSSFIRGMFDGDGCISKDSVSFCGTQSMIKSIKVIMESRFNLRDSPMSKVGAVMHIISWCQNRILILDFLYSGVEKELYLTRKYEKYLQFKEYFNNSKRMKITVIKS